MKKFLTSFGFAFRGFFTAFNSELNLRIHCLVTLIVITAGFVLGISRSEWIGVLGMIALVISAELFNTAIEHLTDHTSPEFSKEAGTVKDVAAAAVLFAAILAVIIGLIIFYPRLMTYLA